MGRGTERTRDKFTVDLGTTLTRTGGYYLLESKIGGSGILVGAGREEEVWVEGRRVKCKLDLYGLATTLGHILCEVVVKGRQVS